jgi:hypothetical protein
MVVGGQDGGAWVVIWGVSNLACASSVRVRVRGSDYLSGRCQEDGALSVI